MRQTAEKCKKSAFEINGETMKANSAGGNDQKAAKCGKMGFDKKIMQRNMWGKVGWSCKSATNKKIAEMAIKRKKLGKTLKTR